MEYGGGTRNQAAVGGENEVARFTDTDGVVRETRVDNGAVVITTCNQGSIGRVKIQI